MTIAHASKQLCMQRRRGCSLDACTSVVMLPLIAFWPSGPCPRLKGRNTVGHRQAAGSTESRSRPGFADRLDTHLRLAIGISTSCMLLPAWPGVHLLLPGCKRDCAPVVLLGLGG